jgi:C1A family cysteine protease
MIKFNCIGAMLILFLFIVSVVICYATKSGPKPMVSFENWAKEHNKDYKDEDEKSFRRSVWNKERSKILAHNSRFERGESTYFLGLNKFSDLTAEEFRETFLMNKKIERTNRPKDQKWRFNHVKVDPGTSVDWREEGVVADVQDQGNCGSCWAFAGTGAASSTYALRSNTSSSSERRSLTSDFIYGAVQEVLDCCDPADSYCCYACDGGEPVLMMNWLALPQGLDASADWPYTSGNTAVANICDVDKMNNPASNVIQIEGGERPPQYDEMALMQALTSRPVAVDIDVEGDFRSYAGGVYTDEGCGTTIWHAVLLVGFDYTGEGAGVDYFIMQNSWGAGWGEGGYMKMSMGVDQPNGVCCVNCYPAIALLNEDPVE